MQYNPTKPNSNKHRSKQTKRINFLTIVQNTDNVSNQNTRAAQHDRHADILGHHDGHYEGCLGDCEEDAGPEQAAVEDLGGDGLGLGDVGEEEGGEEVEFCAEEEVYDVWGGFHCVSRVYTVAPEGHEEREQQ